METTIAMPDVEKMISNFQCPGCLKGSSPCTECPSFHLNHEFGWNCKNHIPGTIMVGVGKIFLGMPKGFNKVGACEQIGEQMVIIRFWQEGEKPFWDYLNIPVWAMEEYGYLFVRTYCPRVNRGYIDVIKGGKFEMMSPETRNVKDFIDDID